MKIVTLKTPTEGFFFFLNLFVSFALELLPNSPLGKSPHVRTKSFYSISTENNLTLKFLRSDSSVAPCESVVSRAGRHALGLQAAKPADWSQNVETSQADLSD